MKRRTPQTVCLKRKRHRKGQNLRLEQLERRDLMTAAPFDPLLNLSSSVCNCPICSGQSLNALVSGSTPSHSSTIGSAEATVAAATYTLGSLPALSSNPGATATLVLDFNGNSLSSWGGKTNVVTPAYDIDGDASTFSDQELLNIQEIWRRVSEDYAPFNINVTTVDPGNLNNQVVAKIAIGGSNADWYGSSAGGVAYVGGFYNGASNVGFAFATNLGNGNARYVAEAASHEAGHLFGLSHQAQWNGTTLVAAYNQGNANWAPIMGVGYYSAVTTWSNGATSASSTAFQDDMAIIANTNNGFGFRTNSIGNSSSAGSLGTTGSVNVGGIIAQNTDLQWWRFTTDGGNATLNVNTITTGANLDSVLEIRDSAGNVLYTANSSTTLNSSLSVSLTAGTYYAVVRSTGVYGYVGQYTLTGSFTPVATTPPAAPEVAVLVGVTGVADGGTVSFGSTTVGTFVDKTFTIRNDGNATLTLQAINTSNLPAGFSIVSNIGTASLSAGQSTTFVVRMTATTAGSFSGVIQFTNNDANEATYDFTVSGTVTLPPAPEVTVLLSGTTFADGGSTSFGTTNVGTFVDKTFTIRNDGNAALTLQAINTSTLPAGFSIVSNIGVSSLAAGQTTTFVVRMTAAAAGSFSGVIRFTSNDADEATYDINVSGTVAAPGTPEVTVLLGGTDFVDGGNASFGSTNVGTVVDKTFTIRNDGSADLTLQNIDTSNLPAGFSIVSNIGSTTLQAGQTTTFTVRMTAAAAGTFSGVIHFTSDDADEATFDVNVSGTVVTPLATLKTVDNGKAGYLGGGTWTTNVGAGFGNDFSFVQPTAGNTFGRWTAIDLAPGTYRISVSYLAFAKAASNARFYFGDDVTTLGSKLINQRVAPAGFPADGVWWQKVAAVTITAGHETLWVQVTNRGVDGFVVADAIRFERIAAPAPSLPVNPATPTDTALAQLLADDAMAQWTRRR
jgi:hypothetical protein